VKIAIVHDYLCGLGGAERVFKYICEEFPEADAHVLAYNPASSLDYFRGRNIRVTWMNRLVQSMDAFRWAFPVATYVMESIDLRPYDIVFSSSATVAKYVRVPRGKHICYCYIPTRAIWHFDRYFNGGVKGAVFKLLLSYFKRRDFAAAQRIDRFLTISQDSRAYIKEYYQREADVINSPIDLRQFAPVANRGKHYLIVSRLEHWKRVDYAIEAFNQLGLPLRIIGSGKDEAELRAMAKSNISFLGSVDDSALAQEYAEAMAVVFTPHLEFGLIPLEALASGTPVICYGKGGITETMIPWESTDAAPSNATAVFFYEQTAESLIHAVRHFGQAKFDPAKLVAHAANWGVPAFKKCIRAAVNALAAEAQMLADRPGTYQP
jgi:glycosyltransferase involved in cell wall biosynthesis